MEVKIEAELVQIPDSERQAVECWTRVMGYFRPFSHFNKGKKSEFKERVWFKERGEKDGTSIQG